MSSNQIHRLRPHEHHLRRQREDVVMWQTAFAACCGFMLAFSVLALLGLSPAAPLQSLGGSCHPGSSGLGGAVFSVFNF